MVADKSVFQKTKCFHCHQECVDIFEADGKSFCCYGCQTVYEILNANNLCTYYSLDKRAGVSMSDAKENNFAYVDEKSIRKKLLSFDSEDFARITFFSPTIHCISCVWLLENLQKLRKGILRSEVNFSKKTVTVDFSPAEIKLSTIAELIASLGYAPDINLDTDVPKKPSSNKTLVLKLAIAGFGFGNIMLFSFPEYLGIDHADHELMRIFSWMNLVLATPVFFYSGIDYLRAAFNSFKQRQINIDVPIALGLIALYFRSAYDIISATGAGYLDSLTGLVFFLLIGRWFQGKTYESLSFDRDFRSYFPLAVQVLKKDEWKPVIIYDLKSGDQIRVRNMEIIPADCTLLDEGAYIDYSFVTGEARPVKVTRGNSIYAGGRLIGQPITLVVERKTSQSHLTSLWNNSAFKKITSSVYQKIIDRAARRFTWIVMILAVVTAIYWQITQPSQVWLVLTSVLMVACPCALALAAPFTYGSMLRTFGKHEFYLKNADVIERLAVIDAIVFDKTGTVTHGERPNIIFNGKISNEQLSAVKLLTSGSTHPLSILITKSIAEPPGKNLSAFKEIPGKGLEGTVNGQSYKIGSAQFAGTVDNGMPIGSSVYVAVNGDIIGFFSMQISMRRDISELIRRLEKKVSALLSGDRDTDRATMQAILPDGADLRFEQTPQDKLDYIRALQSKGKKVMMVGDGLNDAGALKQADVGIAITDDTGVFTPACDGILKGDKIGMLDKFIMLSKSSTMILKTAFSISFFYNAIALGFAVTGHLTPLVAAIIMPVSSISVVGFSSIAVNIASKKLNR